jgi:serine/threonine protein kinase
MTLTPGSRLGVYEVTSQIGEGGMGAVFRARDTKLDRDLARRFVMVRQPDQSTTREIVLLRNWRGGR